MENIQNYRETDGASRSDYKVILLELFFFTVLCLGNFSFFGLPFSSTGIMVLFACYSLWVRGLSWKAVALQKPKSWLNVILLGIAAAIFIVVAFIWVILPSVTWLTGKPVDFSVFEPLHGNLSLLLQNLVFVWVFAAFGEEMIFRAYLISRLSDLIGKTSAGWIVSLILSSIIFGAAHSYQGLTGMINAGIIGCLLGSLYLFSKRNLWAGIICHGLVDTAFMTIVYFNLDAKLFM